MISDTTTSEENTLIVFFSDNGCIKYLAQDICSNDPLSGSKRFHLEGGIRATLHLKFRRNLSNQPGPALLEPVF